MSLTKIAGLVFKPRQKDLERHNNEAETMQREVLARLIGRAQDTEYGLKHAFRDIHNYDQFVKNVPVNSYEELKGFIDRMRHGEENVLWPGRTKWYAKSSGTTNDKSKFIPVTPDGLHRIHYAGAFDTVAFYLRNNPKSRMFDGRGLILGGSHAPNYNLPGSLVGDLSAILIENINPLVNLVRVPKKQTALLSDFEIKRDRIAREAMNKNVTNISGVPSWMLSVLDRVMELSGKTHLEEVWPNIEVFFHGGVAFTPYRQQYERLITSPNMHYMETYNASEGFFGLQNDPDDKSMLLMLDYDVFYEFQEMGGENGESGTIVPLWGVEPGKNYAMLITTSCGLWRYKIGDTVRFTSTNPYKFVISGRTKHFINAFGEELIVDNAEQGLQYACQQTGAEVLEYTAAPVFMDDHARCRHQWLIEFSRPPKDIAQFADLLDKQLQTVNSDYEAKRYKNITLQPLEIVVARQGLFNDWLKQNGKLGGQHKVPRLSNSREHIEQLLKLNTTTNKQTNSLLSGKVWGWISLLLLFVGCARMGSPDGGWYDDTPPYVVSSTPADKATGVKAKRVVINFNEFIKLQDAQSNVIVSPPQLEMPDIKDGGKRIIVSLKDSLKDNTTYTIDFSDAISDNNEGNPMGNYTFTFSTGSQIDTLQVSGYVLNAQDLEPVKGILVGLYDNLSDTIFRKQPMIRVSRTDSRGHFVVKGVAPGTYRAFALQDADGDFVYNQKSEMVAFNHETYQPSWKPDIRQDTIWRDSLHIADILRVPYTHFMPDDITLLAFTAVQDSRYLIKTERAEPNKLGFYFTYGNPELPILNGLNFNSDNAFVADASLNKDTVFYWLRDTALVNQDTLQIEMKYLLTDSTNTLVYHTDTLDMTPKTPYAKRLKAKQKELEEWQKEQEKKKKKGEKYDSIRPREDLKLKITPSGSINPEDHIIIETPTPLQRLDTAAIHLYTKVDSTWYAAKFNFRPLRGNIKKYELTADWNLGAEYSLEIDSAACEDLYGLTSKAIKQGLKVKTDDDYGSLVINLSGIRDTGIVVQLLNTSDIVVRQERANRLGVAEFYYLNPNKYYIRAFVDANGNNLWDTGDYDANRQAEAVYYYPKENECKAKFDVTISWNLTERARNEQKPLEITKQKPDKEKKLRNRNLDRAKELGKEYIQKTTGVRM